MLLEFQVASHQQLQYVAYQLMFVILRLMIKIMCEQLEIWHNIIMYVHTMSYILISGKWYATVTMIRQGFAYNSTGPYKM